MSLYIQRYLQTTVQFFVSSYLMSTLFAAAHSHLILKRLRNTTNDDVNYENIKNVSLDLHTISHTPRWEMISIIASTKSILRTGTSALTFALPFEDGAYLIFPHPSSVSTLDDIIFRHLKNNKSYIRRNVKPEALNPVRREAGGLHLKRHVD